MPLLKLWRNVRKIATASRRGTVLFVTSASSVQLVSNSSAAVIATVALGASQRGVMVLGITIGGVVALVGGMGTNVVVRARLPTCSGSPARTLLLSSYTWWSMISLAVSSATAVAVSVASASFIDPQLADVLLLAGIATYCGSQVLQLQTSEVLYAEGRFRMASSTAALMAAGGLVGMLVALSVGRTAAVLLIGQGVGSALVWLLLAKRLRSCGLILVSRVPLREIGSLVASGFPNLGLSVGLAIALRADRYILGATAGSAAVGIYSLAATFSEIPRILPQAMGQLVMRDSAIKPRGRRRMARWYIAGTLCSALGGIVVAVVGLLVIVPVFGGDFAGARELLIVLVVAQASLAVYQIASRSLLGGGWAKAAGSLGVLGGVVAVACYVVSSLSCGAIGLAFGSVVAYVVLSTGAALLLRRVGGRASDAVNVSA